MRLHELATKATKYGVLSNEVRAVSGACDTVDTARVPDEVPTNSGRSAGSSLRIPYEPGGVACTLDISLEVA
jgi:hypothetical protein